MNKGSVNLLLVLIIGTLFGIEIVSAQPKEIIKLDPIRVTCGDIIEGEFLSNFEQHHYVISLKAGDKLNVSFSPLGDLLKGALALGGPTGLVIAISDTKGIIKDDGLFYRLEGEKNPKLSSGILSASGEYTFTVHNFNWDWGLDDSLGVGVYTLYIGCTLRNGTVINPGDPFQPLEPTVPPDVPTASFSSNGFPGLDPVDFSSAITSKLTVGQTVESTIPPGVDFVLGYTVDAAAKDTLALSFTRLSGNLNLGLVVLSEDNKVVFQASFVTSSELTTKFTLPTAGTYTIGVFRIDLLPPDAPEATAFQLTAALNP